MTSPLPYSFLSLTHSSTVVKEALCDNVRFEEDPDYTTYSGENAVESIKESIKHICTNATSSPIGLNSKRKLVI